MSGLGTGLKAIGSIADFLNGIRSILVAWGVMKKEGQERVEDQAGREADKREEIVDGAKENKRLDKELDKIEEELLGKKKP